MLRREFNWALCSLVLAPYAVPSFSPSRGPLFWLATRGNARVYLFSFGDAQDKSWFTPVIQRAFRDSSELWLEVGSAEAAGSTDATTKRVNADLMHQLEHESGRTFFDALQPAVRSRLSTYMETFDIKKESLETLRPWRAYYVINSAFWAHRQLPYHPVYVDEALRDEATSQGKTIRYEMPTRLDFARFMAGMPELAQSEYISWLLDYIDDQKSGAKNYPFDWYHGYPRDTRSLDRMRAKYPELYRVMQIERNAWWARKINELLTAGGVYFIGIGELHVLGPDGIPNQLQRANFIEPLDLRENPSLEVVG